jgi:hypothetical protein
MWPPSSSVAISPAALKVVQKNLLNARRLQERNGDCAHLNSAQVTLFSNRYSAVMLVCRNPGHPYDYDTTGALPPIFQRMTICSPTN